MAPPRLARAFMTVGLWTLASRVLGFVRDILIAASLGAGPVAEAFLVAFSLPNMFRRFFAEGAFNMAFVPMFSKKLETGGEARDSARDPSGETGAHGPAQSAQDFARDAFSGLAAILIVFTLLAQLAMPGLVVAMASGFADDTRFGLAVVFGRIAFPYILFISLAATLSGVLNATGRFVAAAAAPVLLNVLLISALLAAARFGWPIGLTLAWTVPFAGIAQMALVWAAAARAGFRLVPRRPRLTPELKRLAVIAAPAALAGGVVQVNLLIGRQVASFFDGAVAWLNYADRLYQLPLGVVGIAIGVVLLPELSRRLAASDTAAGQAAFNRATEFALALTLPATAAFLAIPGPLVATLFERGAFTAADSATTATALAIYALGLPAFVLQKVLQPLYYAREDTRRPFRFAMVSMLINAAAAIGLAPLIGFTAAAWGTTFAAWAMVALLWRNSRNMGAAAQPDSRLVSRLPRIALASAAMGALLWAAAAAAEPFLTAGGARIATLAALVILGAAAYFGLGFALRAFRPADFRSAMSRT